MITSLPPSDLPRPLQGLQLSDTQQLVHPAALGRRPEEQRGQRLHQQNLQLPAQVGTAEGGGAAAFPRNPHHLAITASRSVSSIPSFCCLRLLVPHSVTPPVLSGVCATGFAKGSISGLLSLLSIYLTMYLLIYLFVYLFSLSMYPRKKGNSNWVPPSAGTEPRHNLLACV